MRLTHFELDYGADRRKHEIFITTEDSSRFVTNDPPVATYPGFLTIALSPDLGGEVVSQIDATFDFSKMPPHRHATALNWITQQSTLIRLGLWDGT